MQHEQNNGSDSGLFHSLIVLSRYQWFIFWNVFIVTGLAIGISFFLPRWYLSHTTILPPKNQNVLAGLSLTSSSLLRQFNPLRGLSGLGQSPDLYSYIAVLKSRPLLESVVEKFNLRALYRVKNNSMTDAVEELRSNVNFKIGEEGTLRIDVADRDPNRAAAMADYLVKLLDENNRELSAREAHGNRVFLEEQVKQTLLDLRKAEADLKEYQMEHGFAGVTEENNPYYRAYQNQQHLFENLQPLLLQARLEEERDTPTLLVLDKAVVPEIPYRPQKRIIAAIFFFLSLFTSTAVAFFADRVNSLRLSRPDEYAQFAKGWFRLIPRPRRKLDRR